MTDDVLSDARVALANGRMDEALRLAWHATMPAVLSQDSDQLEASTSFAQEVAAVTTGKTREEARQQAAYWSACLEEPREIDGSMWSRLRWFRRTPPEERHPCPQCAELIMVNAKVCRFCGHAL